MSSTGPGTPIDLLAAVVLGLVEGLTEFLPVSSTGHLIVAERLLGIRDDAAGSLFTVGIQMGAITAILVLYWRRLVAAAAAVLRPVPGTPNLLLQIACAAFPAALLGFLCDDWIDAHLFTAEVVAAAMVAGGVLLLWLERKVPHGAAHDHELGTMPYRVAFGIGLFQCLALVPGTSRSAATIAGALLLGLSRTAAAEFSFLVGLPILYGAAGYRLVKQGQALQGELLLPFVAGTLVSFLSALVVVRPFVSFLRRHTFAPFAWYRIVAGALLGLGCAGGFLV